MSSGDAASEVRAIATQLSEIAEKLRDPEVSDEQAAGLAREAAELVSRAGNEIDRATRESEADAGEPATAVAERADYPEDLRGQVEDYLAELRFSSVAATDGLDEAMRYSLLAGGKRIRPVLCLAAARSAGRDPVEVLPAAAAIELIHTYSLIHDDLPAMDDDDLRRGRPTSHVVHGEDVAILAGDGLFAEAIGLFCSSQAGDPRSVLTALGELALATGVGGMVGGQYVDVTADETLDADGLRHLHSLKTGRLIGASVLVPLLIAGLDDQRIDPYRRFAAELGVLFQIVDDILDVTGSDEELGKPQGSDERHGKVTYVSLFGLERARELAAESHANARAALSEVDGKTRDLELVTDFIRTRQK